MFRRAPMGTILITLDFVSRGTEATAFIQCIIGTEPQIHEFWCLGLDEISREVRPTSRVKVTAGTFREFVYDYLTLNGSIIEIIRRLSVNESVQFSGLYDQVWESILPFICNLMGHVEATVWGSGHTSNQDWGGRSKDATSITNVAWGVSVNPPSDYLPRSPIIPCAAADAFATTSFVTGTKSVCGANTIGAIPW